ncbi:MAG: NAD-dependent epimerase/dehydratase family protein [Candidatus Marinimicrobia bacterium]|nr:NAD-dependent epimerase/dehydratase family protein [Candidatus Neomarinimicrobiota bacterium]
MNILVTGGTGFTGSALVLRLLNNGHNVRVLDYKEGIKDHQLREAGARLIYGSVTDASVVDDAVDGCDIVFHVAAAFREMDVSDSYYQDVNVGGTRNVMVAAEKCNVKKVVYCSTQGVHGNIDNPPGDESSPIEPEDYYQQTKYEGEEVVREFIDRGMNATILRPTAIYGPGDPERFFMIFKRVEKGWFPMFGSGKTYYHPVYIDNLVDAFLLVMDTQTGDGGTYIIADEEYVSIRELVRRVAKAMDTRVRMINLPFMPMKIASHVCEKVCKVIGVAPPLFPRRADWYKQVRAFTITKAKEEIGYNPIVGLDEGLRRTAYWYWQEGYLNKKPVKESTLPGMKYKSA